MIYQYRNTRWRSGHRFIGLLILLAGLVSLVGNLLFALEENESRSLWAGIAFTLIGILIASANTGTLLDLYKKQYKRYTTLLGIKWGDWQQLPQIDHIRKGSITEESTNLPNGISPTLSGSTTSHFLLLVDHKEEPVLAFQYDKLSKTESVANLVSKELKVPLKDYS